MLAKMLVGLLGPRDCTSALVLQLLLLLLPPVVVVVVVRSIAGARRARATGASE